MGRPRCRRIQRGARKIGYLLTCCAKGETTDQSNGYSSGSPLRVRTIDDCVTDSSPPLTLHPLDGVGEDDEAVLSTGEDIEALASSLNIEDNHLPQWYNRKLDPGRSLSCSESLTTVSNMSNISLLQWSDPESDIFSQCESLTALSGSEDSDNSSTSSDGDSEGNVELSVDGVVKSPLLMKRDECCEETSTPLEDQSLMSDIYYQEVEDYMRDLLWSTEAEVTSAQQTVPVVATVTDSNDVTSEVVSEPTATDDVDEDNDCKSLRSISSDGHYDILEENCTPLESVVATVHSAVKYLFIRSSADEEVMSITDSEICSESLTTVSSISNFSLLQWDDLEDVSISSESLITLSDSENVNCSKDEESNTDIDDQAVECDLQSTEALVSEIKERQMVSAVDDELTTCSRAEVTSACKGDDCKILHSILNDGHYDISLEDRMALEHVIRMFDTTSDTSSKEDDMDQSTVSVQVTGCSQNDVYDEEQLPTSVGVSNNLQILCSILKDGRYDISEEDQKALESVIATLEMSSKQSAVSDEELATTNTDISCDLLPSALLMELPHMSEEDCATLKEITEALHVEPEENGNDIDSPSETRTQVPSERESTNETLTAEEVQLSVCQNMGKEVSGDSAEKDNQILRSILDDGQYDISAEDRKALESVIANLEVSKEQSAVSDEYTDISCDLFPPALLMRLSHMSEEDCATLKEITAALHVESEENGNDIDPPSETREGSVEEPDCADEWLFSLWQSLNIKDSNESTSEATDGVEVPSTCTSNLTSDERHLLVSILYDGQHTIAQEDHESIQSIIDSLDTEDDDCIKVPSQCMAEDISPEQSIQETSATSLMADSGNCSSDCTVTECSSEWSQSASHYSCCHDSQASSLNVE